VTERRWGLRNGARGMRGGARIRLRVEAGGRLTFIVHHDLDACCVLLQARKQRKRVGDKLLRRWVPSYDGWKFQPAFPVDT
jgi:hypothetical protein